LSTFSAPIKDTKQTVSTRPNIGNNKKKHAEAAIQTGMGPYIQIKQKLSPQNKMVGNKPKINYPNKGGEQPGASNKNRFALFSDVENNQYERGQAVKKSQSALQLQKGTQLK